MLLLYRLGENRFSVSDFPLLYSLYRWHVCFCIIHPSASYTAEKTLLFPGTYWSNNCHSGLKFPHSSYFLFYMFSKVYLKTKKMTDISQTQADFKAKSRRNPLWIPRLFNAKSRCVCRNRRYFRLFRYTLGQTVPCAGQAHVREIRSNRQCGKAGRKPGLLYHTCPANKTH